MTQANFLPSLAPARVRSESRVVPCGWWRLLSSRQLSLPPQHARLLRLLPPISRLHRSQRLARCIGREDAAVFLQPRASHRPPPALPSSPGVVAVVAVVGGTVLHQPSTLRLKTLQACRVPPVTPRVFWRQPPARLRPVTCHVGLAAMAHRVWFFVDDLWPLGGHVSRHPNTNLLHCCCSRYLFFEITCCCCFLYKMFRKILLFEFSNVIEVYELRRWNGVMFVI